MYQFLLKKGGFNQFWAPPPFQLKKNSQCRFCTCVHACTRAHVHVCMRTCTHLFAWNNAQRHATRAHAHALYMYARIYIYIYIYTYTYIYILHTYIHEFMHHDDACAALCFHLRTCMHTGCHIPTCYTRGASRQCVVRCHIRRRHNHCKRRLGRVPQGVGQGQTRVHVHAY